MLLKSRTFGEVLFGYLVVNHQTAKLT